MRGAVARSVLAAGLLALVGVACTGSDNPETPLPCEFYENQRETGVDVTLPPECEQGPTDGTGGETGETTPTTAGAPDGAPDDTTPTTAAGPGGGDLGY